MATLSDSMHRAQSKLANADEVKHQRVVLNMRRRLLEPVYVAWREQHRRERTLRVKVMRRIMSRDLSRGWLWWSEAHGEHRRMLAQLRSAGTRMLHRELARGWGSWLQVRGRPSRESSQPPTRPHIDLAPDLATPSHTFSHLLNTSPGLPQMLEDLATMRKVVLTARNGALSRAFNAWGCRADEAADQQRLMSKCLGRALNRQLGAAFDRWSVRARLLTPSHAFSRRLTPSHAFSRQASNDEGRQMRRFAMRMLRRGLACAMVAWLALAEQRQRLGVMASRMRNHAAIACLARWEAYVAQLSTMRGVLRRALDAALSRAFNTWLDAGEQMGRLRAFAARMLQGALLRAMCSWADFVHERWQMATYARRIAQLGSARCFEAWCEAAEALKGRREAMRRAVHRMLNTALSQALDCWVDLADETRRMRKFAGRLIKAGLVYAFYTWLKQVCPGWPLSASDCI